MKRVSDWLSTITYFLIIKPILLVSMGIMLMVDLVMCSSRNRGLRFTKYLMKVDDTIVSTCLYGID